MSLPALKVALAQTSLGSGIDLPPTIKHETPIPKPPTEPHVLVRVLAVALNLNNHKMITHLHMSGGVAGRDFCGLVELSPDGHTVPRLSARTKICGSPFVSNPPPRDNSSFAQWLVADSRILVEVPTPDPTSKPPPLGSAGQTYAWPSLIPTHWHSRPSAPHGIAIG
ncbi:hypothetical protein BDW72DRAFT_192428 [Aspergillus terricola var. indicus]